MGGKSPRFESWQLLRLLYKRRRHHWSQTPTNKFLSVALGRLLKILLRTPGPILAPHPPALVISP